MSEPLFSIEESGAVPKQGQDAKRTNRRLAKLAGGRHPVTNLLLHADAAPADDRQADGLRCDSCAHLLRLPYHNRTYLKCGALPLTHGPGTDTSRWYPACVNYEEPAE